MKTLILAILLAATGAAASAQDLERQTSQDSANPLTAWSAALAPDMHTDISRAAPAQAEFSCAAAQHRSRGKGESLTKDRDPKACVSDKLAPASTFVGGKDDDLKVPARHP